MKGKEIMTNLEALKNQTHAAIEAELAALADRVSILTTVLHGRGDANISPLALKSAVSQLAKMPDDRPRRGRPKGSKNRPKTVKGNGKPSEARVLSMEIQGKYLSLLRQIPESERNDFKAMGRKKAIPAMKRRIKELQRTARAASA